MTDRPYGPNQSTDERNLSCCNTFPLNLPNFQGAENNELNNVIDVQENHISSKQRLINSYYTLQNPQNMQSPPQRNDRYCSDLEEIIFAMKNDIDNMKYQSSHLHELQQQLRKFRDDIGNLTEICTNTINTVVDLRNDVQMMKAQMAEYKLTQSKVHKSCKKKVFSENEPYVQVNRIDSLKNCQFKSYCDKKRCENKYKKHCHDAQMYKSRCDEAYNKSKQGKHSPDIPDAGYRREFYSPYLSSDGIKQRTAFEMLPRNDNRALISPSPDPNLSMKIMGDINSGTTPVTANDRFNRQKDCKFDYNCKMQYHEMYYNVEDPTKKLNFNQEDSDTCRKDSKMSSYKPKQDVANAESNLLYRNGNSSSGPKPMYSNQVSPCSSKTKRKKQYHQEPPQIQEICKERNNYKARETMSPSKKEDILNRYTFDKNDDPSASVTLSVENNKDKNKQKFPKKDIKHEDIHSSDKSSSCTIKSDSKCSYTTTDSETD